MGKLRVDLHTRLVQALGSTNVYFQPPPNIQMVYPCIVYRRDRAETRFANDFPYTTDMQYELTVIDRDPDSEIPGRVAQLPRCSHERFFTADDLNHDVFNIFF